MRLWGEGDLVGEEGMEGASDEVGDSGAVRLVDEVDETADGLGIEHVDPVRPLLDQPAPGRGDGRRDDRNDLGDPKARVAAVEGLGHATARRT